ncbi:MAG: hypothetical protein A2W80_14780 [Candidatus Riflebacteria bacterium GWC2_50_8]|nr:MAG: hypothetical protein A2W80_14780 [Candidatus Riflebacteria bacterium GWC2_50_8]
MTGKRHGFSLFEMLIVVAIMGLIALAAVPVAEITYVKSQETFLENNLADIRQAIALWKRDCLNVVNMQKPSNIDVILDVPDCNLCPPTLEALFKPAPPYSILASDSTFVADFYPRPYLHTIPQDPFIGAAEWAVHYASGSSVGTYTSGITTPPDADHIGVFDVSCIADPIKRRGFVKAIDGTNYSDW